MGRPRGVTTEEGKRKVKQGAVGEAKRGVCEWVEDMLIDLEGRGVVGVENSVSVRFGDGEVWCFEVSGGVGDVVVEASKAWVGKERKGNRGVKGEKKEKMEKMEKGEKGEKGEKDKGQKADKGEREKAKEDKGEKGDKVVGGGL